MSFIWEKAANLYYGIVNSDDPEAPLKKVFKKKFESIGLLESYSTTPPQDHFMSWPRQDIPSTPRTRVNVEGFKDAVRSDPNHDSALLRKVVKDLSLLPL